MWKDPTDQTYRKPQRLRGTPANKIFTLIAGSMITVYYSFFIWYTNSEIAWIQAARERSQKRFAPTEDEKVRRAVSDDPVLASFITQIKERKLSQEYDSMFRKK